MTDIDYDDPLFETFRKWNDRQVERADDRKAERAAAKQERGQMWGEPAPKLLRILESKISHYEWETEGLIRAGREQKADILGTPSTSKAPKIFIELEIERATCVRNVVKAWMYVDNDEGYTFVVHVFSPFFQTPERIHFLEETLFIGDQAQEATNGRLIYLPIPLDHWPEENESVLEQLVEKIIRRMD